MEKKENKKLIPPSSLKEEDEKHKLILRQMETLGKIGHWEVDFVKQTLHWSEGVFYILEMDPSAMPVDLEKGFLSVHPDDRERAVKHMQDVLETGIKYDLECRLITTTGKIIFVHSLADVIRGEKNEPLQIVGIFQDITEQREAYQNLLQKELRLSTILKSEPECVKVVSPEGILIEMNPAGLQMIEADHPEEALGQKVENLVYPEDLVFYQSLHKNALQGIQSSARFRIIGLKGTKRWMESTAVPLTNQLGEITSVLSVTRDISEKVSAEENLIRIKKNQEALINGTSDLIWSLDSNYRLIAANQAFLDVMGFLLGVVAKEGDSVLILNQGEAFYEKWKGYYERGLSGETFKTYEKFLSPITGKEEHREVFFNPIRNTNQEITGLACFSKDITDLMLKRMELVSSERRYRALVENGVDVIAILSAEGFAKYVSPSITKVLGYSEKEAMEMNLFDFLHPDDVPKIKERLEEVITLPEGNSLPSHNFRVKHQNGSWRWMESTITNLMDDESIGGIVDNFHDVTERVVQITAIQTQNEKLKAIAWTQSHVVRNPLAKLMGIVDLIKTGTLSPTEERKSLDHLIESAKELDEIIQDIVLKSQRVIVP
ncbi:PAS domain S-box protein [Leptospira kanakyensis]|uniref:histidine kinase n=1 Tax=Leptospira kanakyensis TaxID=2484968 RepID=A0A6N4QGR3_9LEPT|nr:PAS domain S-box protein [Leptospira kanakyensis]TGK51604.1 PAS domain S-box protein [Leptospira kanakyensis]TGK58695.1 PAS domain S-box protein [Leptospira kanakyensis]TGK70898.1 PAS domain S-box protein [Leptospira kanakyensis]